MVGWAGLAELVSFVDCVAGSECQPHTFSEPVTTCNITGLVVLSFIAVCFALSGCCDIFIAFAVAHCIQLSCSYLFQSFKGQSD